MIRAALGWLGWQVAAVVLCAASAGTAHAQGSFLIYAPPEQYSEDPTGMEFPEVFFDKHWDPPVVASIGLGGVSARSGLFDEIANSGSAQRLQLHHPTMRRPTEIGDLFLGWTGGFEHASYNGKEGNQSFVKEGVAPPPFTVEGLDTMMFGVGPEATFYFHPWNDGGPQAYFATGFEGIAGWVDPDVALVDPGTPAVSQFRVSGENREVGTDNAWGYRAGMRVGVAWDTGWALSTSVSTSLIRTKAVSDIEDTSFATTWMVHVEANTRAVASQVRQLWSGSAE